MSYTLMPNLKPASRKEAFNIVTKLVSGVDLTEQEKQELLLYFAPKGSAKPKDAESWVAKAVGVKDVRPYLNYLYSDGKRLIATDTHRIHWCPTTRPEGFYCPKTLAPFKVDDWRYTDVDRVIPKATTPVVVDTTTLETELDEVESKWHAYRDVAGRAICKRYLDEALAGDTTVTVLNGDGGKNDAILGESRFGGFVIAPMRL